MREIAQAIGEGLGLPVRSLGDAEAAPHFGFLAMVIGADTPAKCAASHSIGNLIGCPVCQCD